MGCSIQFTVSVVHFETSLFVGCHGIAGPLATVQVRHGPAFDQTSTPSDITFKVNEGKFRWEEGGTGGRERIKVNLERFQLPREASKYLFGEEYKVKTVTEAC